MRSRMLLVFLAASSVLLLAQTAPIKMGLWEKTMETTRDGAATTTLKAKSCVTAADWQRMTENAQKQHEGCTMKNDKTAHGYTFSNTCTMATGGSMVVTGTSSIQDSEHIVSESHTTMTMKGQKHEMQMKSNSHFVSASCGDIKPGDPVIQDK